MVRPSSDGNLLNFAITKSVRHPATMKIAITITIARRQPISLSSP